MTEKKATTTKAVSTPKRAPKKTSTVTRTVSVKATSTRSTKSATAAKKVTSSKGKILKRYTKRGVKSLLLSPVFQYTFKTLSVVFVFSGFLYASYFFIGKTFANEVVISQSEIISRVSKLTAVPKEEPYEIVRVQDEDNLRKQNSFYKDVHEGDYILMYRDVAVIYDLRNNVIVGVKRTENQ